MKFLVTLLYIIVIALQLQLFVNLDERFNFKKQIINSETRCEEQIKSVQDLLEERIGILEVQVESLVK